MSDGTYGDQGRPTVPGQAPGPVMPPVDPPPRRGPSRTVLIVIAVVAVLVLLGCCGVGAVALLLSSGSGGSGSWDYSKDQQAVIADLGTPQTFTIMFAGTLEDDFDSKGELPLHRIEQWEYWDYGVRLAFRDGYLLRTEDLKALPAGAYDYPKLEPSDFAEGMTPKQVRDAIGGDPDGGFKFPEESQLRLVTATWAKQVAATFQEKRVAMVVTMPVRTGEAAK